MLLFWFNPVYEFMFIKKDPGDGIYIDLYPTVQCVLQISDEIR